jgi:hypothetical protein
MERSTSTLDIFATFCRVIHIQNHGYIKFIGDLNFTLQAAGPANLQLAQRNDLVKAQNSLPIQIQQALESGQRQQGCCRHLRSDF